MTVSNTMDFLAAIARPESLIIKVNGMRDNVFIGESFPGSTGGTVQEPSVYYPYKVDDPNTIKATVLAGAGTGHV